MYVQTKYSSLHDKKSEEKPLHKLRATETFNTFLSDCTALRQYLLNKNQFSHWNDKCLLKNVPWKHSVSHETTHLFLGVWEERLVEYIVRIQNQLFSRTLFVAFFQR